MPAVVSTTRVESTPELGRVLVSNSSFALGEEVLRETPLLSWPSNNWDAYIDTLCEVDEGSRMAVFDMFHPSISSSNYAIQDLRTKAEELLSSGNRPSFCDLDFVHRALLIAKLNAHSFQGGQRLALFKTGSKVAHSCYPNCSYSSKTVEGMLVFKAIRPIAPNEHITMSYIDELWLKSTTARRAELMETKLFLCHCVRCDKPDPLRAMPCTTDESHYCWVETAPPADGSSDVVTYQWRCIVDGCGIVPSDGEKELLQLEESAVSHKLQNEVGMALVEYSSDEPEKVKEITTLLPRTNATVIRSHILLATVLRIRAEDATDSSRAKKLRLRAAQENIKAVSLMQCVAANCKALNDCASDRHPALYQCCPQMLEAARDLHLAGNDEDDANIAAGAVCRYVPLMFQMWPQMRDDANMLVVIEDLKRWSIS